MQQAVAMVMDLATAKLVVGTLYDDEEALGYKHAWVLQHGRYFDPSLYSETGRLSSFDTYAYLAERKATDVKVVDRAVIMRFARRGGLSSWMRGPGRIDHKLQGVMGEVLLRDLGVQFSLGPNRELWPPADAA